jgi:superfamily II DNA or RNA helicase
MPEVYADEAGAAAANERRMRMVRARERMRQVDAVNRKKLRVLQVALEESWEVARILENSQYKEDVRILVRHFDKNISRNYNRNETPNSFI